MTKKLTNGQFFYMLFDGNKFLIIITIGFSISIFKMLKVCKSFIKTSSFSVLSLIFRI
jgi:hypothetical protein